MEKTGNYLLEQKVKKRLLSAVEEENPPLSFFEDLFCCPFMDSRSKRSEARFTTGFADVPTWKQKVNDKLITRLYKLEGKKLKLLWEALQADNLLYALKIIAEGRRKFKNAATKRSNIEDLVLKNG